ncbi:hypothetical protein T440DRAFT_491062 [Plenodomus tracheiphilus IPT5]|uniref:Uncharacterized protein n=1 Tax=Plenodomus tracheiphilus IPT5 TaxID=1408161 RepID=A0A6A7AZU6_9PLEO|nr:hypothetical protein T440DRAFT_491062 [Plenodomus tracheiphilus IPT5]
MPPACTPGPSTPGPRPSTPGSAGAAATPGTIRRRVLPSSTTNNTTTANALPNTTFPPRTPRTPASSTGPVCTTDATLFRSVNIHTAKCTECDKRNKAIMRRCPGCTFQVCTPCFEKREKEGRGLRHGISMSGSASPATARTVRVRVVSSSGGGAGEGDKGVQELGKGKEAVKQEVLPKKRAAVKKKKKSARFVDSEDEEDEELSSEGYDPEEHGTPTPSKRRRSTLTMERSASECAPPQRVIRKRPVPSSNSTNRAPTTPSPGNTDGVQASPEMARGEMGVNELMRTYGVNTAENPYDEHLLSRREPVVYNPTIRIPEIIKRGFKPRPSSEEIQRNIQEKTRKKLREQQRIRSASAAADDESLQYPQDQRTKAPVNDDALTVRMFVETEAAKYRDDVTMDEDENKALAGLLEAEALSWGTRTFRTLTPDEQSLMRPGLNVRLDLLSDPEAAKSELAALLKEHAAEKLWRIQEDQAC